MNKYKLDRSDKIKVGSATLYRIVALRDFGNVKKGNKGGYIQAHKNLSHDGNAWVFDDARVFGIARVYGSAFVFGNAQIYGSAFVFGNAQISD